MLCASELGAGFVDQFFPDAAGFEDDFDDFAGGAFAAEGCGDVVGDGFYFGDGVTDGYGEAYAAHYGKIGEVVAKIGDFGFFQRRSFSGFLRRRRFCGAAFRRRIRFSVRWQRRRRAALSRPVMTPVRMPAVWARVRPWPSWASKVLISRAEPSGWERRSDAAVGDGAVDVHEEDFDLFGAFARRGDFGLGARASGND